MEPFQNNQPVITQEALLHRIANRIRQSLELKEILNATVAEVRAYLQTDRVKIYQFNPDGSGVVIAESIQENRLPSLLGLHFPADDIPLYARELFVKARQRSIVDITNHSIGISPLNLEDTGELLGQEDIRYRPVDPCHVEYLTAMEVKSSVVVPIVLEAQETGKNQPPSLRSKAQLWGLLVSHHSESRIVTEQELQFIQAVVDQVGVAIAQSILLNQVRSQAQQEANINQITTLLHSSETVVWQAALEEAVKTFHGSGGRLYLLPDQNQALELYLSGSQPEPLNIELNRVIEENLLWQKFLYSVVEPYPDQTGHKPWSVEWMRAVYNLNESINNNGISLNLWVIDDLYREPLFRTLAPFFQSTKIKSLLIIPLYYGSQVAGCLTIFREEVDIEILWAGWHNPDTRQLMPRQSFEVWRQYKKGQAQVWTDEEIKYGQALSEPFSAATKQYRLYQQIQALNSNLELQVQERTEQLQLSNIELKRSVEQQKTLSRIIAKIRKSLEIDIIFQTTTQELSQVLQAERVAVYRFDRNWGGKFIGNFEFATQEWMSVGNLGVNPVWNDTYLQEHQGGKYRNGEISVIDDVYQAGYAQCHIDLLEQFHVKALIIVPIFVKQNLWGLLGVYQHQAPRHWENSEVEFLRQIAAQLGVALEQADLLTQTKYQAEQLALALQDLQATQSKLIQTEKMSSLGQLVAGVAHEINNPINFIHGNLGHVNEYVHNLLKFLSLYQNQFPNPDFSILESAIAELDLEFIGDDLPKILSSMQIGTERIRQIVLSLRNFSRLDQADLKAVDIHEGIDSTLLILHHRLKATANRPGIELVKEYGILPNVECYAGLLNQVFMNILSNAIDALEQSSLQTEEHHSTIWIRTQVLDDNRVALRIKDNGIGIPEELQHKLFNPFFTTKPVGKGTGLGLSISYQIINDTHKGELKCRSTPGQGTEFIIEIPIRQH